METLASEGEWLLLPLLPCGVVAILGLVARLFGPPKVLLPLFAIVHWAFFVGVFASNVVFLVAIYPFDLMAVYIGTGLLCFALYF